MKGQLHTYVIKYIYIYITIHMYMFEWILNLHCFTNDRCSWTRWASAIQGGTVFYGVLVPKKQGCLQQGKFIHRYLYGVLMVLDGVYWDSIVA